MSPVLHSLLAVSCGSEWHPEYDFEFVEWQIGRCPSLVPATCYIPEAPHAALLYWRSDSTNSWRIAVWALDTAWNEVQVLLLKAIRQISVQRGMLISAIVSRLDSPLIKILAETGFRMRSERIPLYTIIANGQDVKVSELNNMNYLDCDFAYRF